ncbi:MAG: class I SAM-dependent methyltransferase [Nitrospinota bacterium]
MKCGRGTDALQLCRPGRLVVGLEPSRAMLRQAKKNGAGNRLLLVQGVAEQPPFKTGVFDRIVCKGAIDHFSNPALCVYRLCSRLKPGGKLVVAVANFESLSCWLARRFSPIAQTLKGKGSAHREFWEPPEDHLHLFHYANLKMLLGRHCSLEKMEGLSLMWGFPHWGDFLDRLPRGMAQGILKVMDSVASRMPFFGDVILAVARR